MLNEQTALATEEFLPDFTELSRVSDDFFQAAAGLAEGAVRDPGLLVTNEDVRRIHRYVGSGLALPTDLAQVRQLLGNYDSGISGLQPEDIKQLYLNIQDHAGSWSILENDMRDVGSDLHVFAGNLVGTAEDMIAFIRGLDTWQTLKMADLSVSDIEQMPAVALSDTDRKQLPGLLALVDELKIHVNHHSSSTRRVKDGLEVFKARLRDQIRAELARKIDLAKSAEASDKVVQLKDEIELVSERINQKAAEYQEYCDKRLIGIWWGPVGMAITWTIYGIQASDVLAEHEKLIAEKEKLQTQLRQHSRFISDLLVFETSLQDLKTRIDGAASGVSNIESLWGLLEKLADDTRRRISDMDNALLLVVFVSRFNSVISNWLNIKQQAFNLLTAFNNVVGEARR